MICQMCNKEFTLPERSKRKTCSGVCQRKLQKKTSGKEPRLSHGQTGTRLHNIWRDMLKRCKFKKEYKGRGISVCEEWLDFRNFYVWATSSGYKETLTIERKDNDKNYSPDNCVWSGRKEQARNRRTSVYLEIDGIKMTISEWAEKSNVPYATFYARIFKLGWAPERAISPHFEII